MLKEYQSVKKKRRALIGIVIGILMVLLGIFLLNDYSFPLIGMALVIIALSLRSFAITTDLFRIDKKP